ncbi:shk-1 [Bugula neritina]|uniref:Shk-1 n=1 Tax=Bugula neritina TaxID=10212 RepID=A0A7J7K6P0_BUGNE|nr:shk-1 [Bugula neritina]
MIWNTWAPLTGAAVIGFQWTEGQITALQALSGLVYIVAAFPILYVIEKYGLRLALLLTFLCAVVGNIAWVLGVYTNTYWVVAVGSPLVGVGMCSILTAPSLLSLTWFPVNERNTATGCASIAVYVGVGLGFIAGPNIVGTVVTVHDLDNATITHSEDYLADIRNGVRNTMYCDCALAVLSCLLVFIHFPNKPPLPPTQSQAAPRVNYWDGVKHVLKSKQFYILNMAFNICVGIFNSWLPLASIILRPLGIDQKLAGWIGFSTTPASIFGSILLTRLADKFKRNLRLLAIISTSVGMILVGVLACILQGYILISSPLTMKVVVFILYFGICLCINGSIPLYYEMGCEMAYPAHEAVVGVFLQILQLTVIGIYLLLLLNDSLDTNTEWMTWTLFAGTLVAIVLWFVMNDRYPRLELDNLYT